MHALSFSYYMHAVKESPVAIYMHLMPAKDILKGA